MAEHIHTTYSCDRCAADLGAAKPYREPVAIIKASFASLQKPAQHFEWNHLCDRCDTAVRAFFLTSPIEMNVTGHERREARVWWAEVSAYVNTEMAEYIMVRARRVLGGWKP